MLLEGASSIFVVTALLVTHLLASPVVLHPSLKLEWESWKSTHEKTYEHEREESERSVVWMNNKKLIDTHNAVVEDNGYTLAMNEFGDMTDEEWRNNYLGSFPEPNNTKSFGTVYQAVTGDLPSYMDWRNKNAVAPVKNQGQCNSSYAFSALAALEGASAMITGEPIPFSEQNILDCTVPYGNHGCNGGSVYNTLQYILSEGGVDKAIDYSYKAKQGQCFFDDKKATAGISGMVRIQSGSESDLLSAVATVGPVSVNVDASSSTFRFYSGGIFDTAHCSSTSLNHAMVITGYGTYKNKKYWLVKNSWGKSWGEVGYIKMVRDSYNQCGIASSSIYPTL